MQMRPQVAFQVEHYGIDWPEVIFEAGSMWVSVKWTVGATTVFLSLTFPNVYNSEEDRAFKEIDSVVMTGGLRRLLTRFHM